MTTQATDLSPAAMQYLRNARLADESTLDHFRDLLSCENSSPMYAMSQYGESAIIAEQSLRWWNGVDYALSDAGSGLDSLLREVEDRCDRWTPTNSTSLHARLEGDLELRSLRAMRKRIREALKLNAA